MTAPVKYAIRRDSAAFYLREDRDTWADDLDAETMYETFGDAVRRLGEYLARGVTQPGIRVNPNNVDGGIRIVAVEPTGYREQVPR